MKDQLQTIREAHSVLYTIEATSNAEQEKLVSARLKIRDALAQLEAMAGEQEPVAWANPKTGTVISDKEKTMWRNRCGGINSQGTNDDNMKAYAAAHTEPCFAAPVAQQQEPVGYLHPQAKQRLENGETVAFRKTPYAGEPTLAVYVGAAPVAQQPQDEPKCECNATMDTFCEVCTEYRKWKQPQADDTIKRQAQKIAELTADRDGWVEAHARLHREYHDFRKAAPQQAEAVPPDVVRDADVEAAAKKMAEIFDYPWDFMPEKGRNTMRENVRAVLDAAIAQQKGGV